ncbi:MAG TPA: hypothetical protein VGH28_04030 [Polyangiaceae bacterium]
MKDPHERELEEVERALSVLGGRHPDAVRAQREAAEAAAKRRREHEVIAAAERKRAMRRRALVAIAIVAVGAAAFAGYRAHQKRTAIAAEVEPLVARYVARGFEALPRSSWAPENRVEVTTVPGDCYAFVAARGASMRIERPIGSAGAKGEALVCTCATENVVVTTDAAPVRALHVAGASFGGSRALAYHFADSAPTVVAGDDACAEDSLAAYARDARYPKQEPDGAWLAAHASLASSSFTTLASAPPRLPYLFVPAAASTCFLVDGGDLSLWTLDGGVQKPLVHQKTIAWCVAKPATFIVERGSAAGTLSVVAASSPRIGGMIGLRELASRAGLSPATWLRDDEHGALAADVLRASVVPDPTAVGSQTIAASKDVRVLAFSSAVDDTFSSTEADFRCDPPLLAHDAVCVQARPLTWHEPPGGVVCGAAYGPLPYWMSVLADVRDASVVDAELALVGFARRMSARGFSPTIIEGVTEHEDSVEILGRSGDDAVVAVGVWPTAPYVHPYGDPPWALDGEPTVVRLAGGVRVTLRLRDRAAVPLASRRTVVFRHSTN